MMWRWSFGCVVAVAAILSGGGCRTTHSDGELSMSEQVQRYATVRLTADLTRLSPRDRQMIPLLIEAARQMDEIFWQEAYGDKEVLWSSIRDRQRRRFAEINYGPWDRLGDNRPFVPGVGPKPAGANFYPPDLTRDAFEAALLRQPEDAEALKSLYTVVRRDPAGGLRAIPYHEFFAEPTRIAADKLRAAAALADDPGLRRYLQLRADALLTSDYRPSDMAWLDMKGNLLDIVIGPIETYEDALFGYKAAHEAYVLVKDVDWSRRLSRYAALLPDLQRGLPVDPAYKDERPGSDSDLNAYDVIYYAGDCNAGAKTIAINLPNDEVVQLQKGTRRLQLKNAMRAKFDHILVPIAEALIDPSQQQHITFDAFFGNTMFHEVAHGLGIKNTITGKGTVRDALKDQAAALEEGKADILGLYMVRELFRKGEMTTGDIRDHYVTFLAGIFRSVRFGASSAHGRANMLRFNFFKEHEAFSRDAASGRYRVQFDNMEQAMELLCGKILRLQGDGDYDGISQMMASQGQMSPTLKADLERLGNAGIPVDIVFEQGVAALRGL